MRRKNRPLSLRNLLPLSRLRLSRNPLQPQILLPPRRPRLLRSLLPIRKTLRPRSRLMRLPLLIRLRSHPQLPTHPPSRTRNLSPRLRPRLPRNKMMRLLLRSLLPIRKTLRSRSRLMRLPLLIRLRSHPQLPTHPPSRTRNLSPRLRPRLPRNKMMRLLLRSLLPIRKTLRSRSRLMRPPLPIRPRPHPQLLTHPPSRTRNPSPRLRPRLPKGKLM